MSAIRFLRIISIIEAISYLLLLGLAMPLKYIWDQPSGVYYLGRAHGGLFVLLLAALLWTLFATRWTLKQPTIVFLASLVPLVPFFLDKWLKREQEKQAEMK